MRPVLCFVADRTRSGGSADALVARVAAAARAGVHLVQVRERYAEARDVIALVARCVDAVRGTPTRILVNERADVALSAGAHGVHLRADSVPAARLRTLAPAGWLIGRSVHTMDEVLAASSAGGCDYLIFGTVFGTASKPGVSPAGVEELLEVTRRTRLPVLAIGGVTTATAARVAAAGAAGIAAIGLFADGPVEQLHTTVQTASLAFDTPVHDP